MTEQQQRLASQRRLDKLREKCERLANKWERESDDFRDIPCKWQRSTALDDCARQLRKAVKR